MANSNDTENKNAPTSSKQFSNEPIGKCPRRIEFFPNLIEPIPARIHLARLSRMSVRHLPQCGRPPRAFISRSNRAK